MLTWVNGTDWSKRTTLARIISDVANPFFVAPAVLLVLAVFNHFTIVQLTGILVLSSLFYTVIPLLVLVAWQHKTQTQDYDLVERNQRIRPYATVLISYAVGGFLIYWYAPAESTYLKTAALCYLISPSIGFLITLGWKVSLHSASVGTALAVLFWYPTVMHSSLMFMTVYYFILTGLFILLPFIMWSRLQLNVHTFNQVTVGALLGFFVSSGVLIYVI